MVSNNESTHCDVATATSTPVEEKTTETQVISDEEQADELRLQGNDAFSTQDYSRALSLYNESVSKFETAKTCANLAATLCKLGKYEIASHAAKRATVLDSKWAKGWWRRGVVSELHKDFGSAHRFFDMAVDLDPKTKGFRISLRKIEKRLGLKDSIQGSKSKSSSGTKWKTMDPRNIKTNIKSSCPEVVPTKAAYLQIKNEIGGSPHFMLDKFRISQEQGIARFTSAHTTSKQFFFQGFLQWVGGIQTAIANLCFKMDSSAAGTALMQIQGQFSNINGTSNADPEPMTLACEEVLGGLPECIEGVDSALDNMVSGFAYLGGKLLFLESEDSFDRIDQFVVPQPRMLRGVKPYQPFAICNSIDESLEKVMFMLGPKLKLAPAVFHASKGLYENLRMEYPHKQLVHEKDGDELSPEDCVEYVKHLLASGHTWEGGVRSYVALQYKGSILNAFVIHLMTGLVAQAYKWEKWAMDFVSLLDDNFSVKKNRAYREKGSSFRDSLQIGILMSHFAKHEVLRANAIAGAYSIKQSMDLAMEMSRMANRMETVHQEKEYHSVQWEVACKRKPLAMAHSAIGQFLNTLRQIASPDLLESIILDEEFFDGSFEDDAEFDPFVLAASQYKIAAENELEDAADAAIYWWAYAGLMAQSDPKSGFTLGMLRDAMKKAMNADESRDINIFGTNNPHDGGSYQTLVTSTVNYYHDREESFVLPQIEILDHRREGGGYLLKVEDEIVCDMEKCLETAAVATKGQGNGNNIDDVEKEYGQVHQRGVPSLEVICIRALHKSGCEFAKGENDGAVIQYKALKASMVAAEDE